MKYIVLLLILFQYVFGIHNVLRYGVYCDENFEVMKNHGGSWTSSCRASKTVFNFTSHCSKIGPSVYANISYCLPNTNTRAYFIFKWTKIGWIS